MKPHPLLCAHPGIEVGEFAMWRITRRAWSSLTKHSQKGSDGKNYADPKRPITTLSVHEYDWVCMMSDHPCECSQNVEFIKRAYGRVLIHGLGLGIVLRPLLEKRVVECVHVIEKSGPLIERVGAHYEHENLTIQHDDAVTWVPPAHERWDVVWTDIWHTSGAHNIIEAGKIAQNYAGRTKQHGFWFGPRSIWAEEGRIVTFAGEKL